MLMLTGPFMLYAGLPNSSDDKAELKGLRKQVTQLQSDLANEKASATLQVEAAASAWSRGRWFRFDGLSRIAANARPVHLHVPFVHAVHPLLDSPIELLKLYGTVQK